MKVSISKNLRIKATWYKMLWEKLAIKDGKVLRNINGEN